MSCRLVWQRSLSAFGVSAVYWKPLSSPRSVHQQAAGFPRGGDHTFMRAEPGVAPKPCAPQQLLLRPLGQCHRPSSSSSIPHHPYPTSSSSDSSQMLLDIITSGGGCLDDLEASLDRLGVVVTPALVTQIILSCSRAPDGSSSSSSRRLLRFFSWCRHNSHEELGDEVFNLLIRAFAEMKDLIAMGIAISDFQKEGRKMDPETFVHVAETLVRSGRPDEAVRLFRWQQQQQPLLWQGGGWSSVTAIVHALCNKGHAREAQRIVWRHKGKLVAAETGIIHQSLLHGWCVHGNAREARRVIDQMKSLGIHPGLASYHDFLRCICKRNLKFNPSALVLEATDVMTEMRCSGVPPTAVSFNILLSCLGRSRRVKESCRILVSMMCGEAGCSPDWVSYYLVARVLYLTGRFVRGHRVVDQMIEKGVMPAASFYHGLIGVLCGMEKMDHALTVFERMKRSCGQNNGPTYDMLIAKFCRNGKFDIGRSLWDGAVEKGISLQCSSDLLDPLKMKVFRPIKAVVKLNPSDCDMVLQKRRKLHLVRKVKRKKCHTT